MKTIALRFGETFSPECGTIAAHQEVINQYGSVWYGKMGSPVAERVISEISKNTELKILLINSGKMKRYWAYVSEISKELPNVEMIPKYYRNDAKKFKTWFRITEFKNAPRDIMAKCYVSSSKMPLSLASRRSMSPYFIIEYNEE